MAFSVGHWPMTDAYLQPCSTDLKDVEKQFESFFKLHYGIFKSRFFLFTTFIRKKLNYVKISFRCFYYLKTKEPFREPARIAKRVEKIQLFFSIRFDPNTWTIKLFTWKNVATGSKIILRTKENVPIRTDSLKTFQNDGYIRIKHFYNVK